MRDREYAEGKNQNRLRPKDIEKIDFVFTSKREIPYYSRLVDKSEITEKHDYEPPSAPDRQVPRGPTTVARFSFSGPTLAG